MKIYAVGIVALTTLIYTTLGQNICGDDCVDVDPKGNFSCADQAKWGKCDEDWMSTCNCACGRCTIIIPP